MFSRLLWLAYEGPQHHQGFIRYLLEQRPGILAAFPGLDWFDYRLHQADAQPPARSRRQCGGGSRPLPLDAARPALSPLQQPGGPFQAYMQYVLTAELKITVRLEWQCLRIWALPAAADGTRDFVHIIHSIARSDMASSATVSCTCRTGRCIHLRLYEEILVEAVGPPAGAPEELFTAPAQPNLWTAALQAGMAHPQDDDAVLLCAAQTLGHVYWSVLAQTVDGPQPAVVCQRFVQGGATATGDAQVRAFADCSEHTARTQRSGSAFVTENMAHRCPHIGIVFRQCDASEAPVRASRQHCDIAVEDGEFRYVGDAAISRWVPQPCWSYQRVKPGNQPGARTADRDRATAERLGQAIGVMDENNRKIARKSQQASSESGGEIFPPQPAALRVPLTEAEREGACACGPRSRWIEGKFSVVLRDRRVPATVESLVCTPNCASESDKALMADGAALGLWQYGRMFYDVGLFYDMVGGAFREREGLSLHAFWQWISGNYANADLLSGVQGTPMVSVPTLSHAAFSFLAQLDPAGDEGHKRGCPLHKFGCPRWVADGTTTHLPVSRHGSRIGGVTAFDADLERLPQGVPLQARLPVGAAWVNGKFDKEQNVQARKLRTKLRHLAKLVLYQIKLLQEIHTTRPGSASSAGLQAEEQRFKQAYAMLPPGLQNGSLSKRIIAQTQEVVKLRRDWLNDTKETLAPVLPPAFFEAAARLLAWLIWSTDIPDEANPWLAAFPDPDLLPDLREVDRLARVVDELGSEACIATVLRLDARQPAVDLGQALAGLTNPGVEAEVRMATTIRWICPHLGDYLLYVAMHEQEAHANQTVAAAAAAAAAAAGGVPGPPPGQRYSRSVAAGVLTILVEKLDQYVEACQAAGCPINMPYFDDVPVDTEAFCGGLADGDVLKAGGRSYLNPSGRQLRLFYPSALDKSKNGGIGDDHEGGCDKRSLIKPTRGTVPDNQA